MPDFRSLNTTNSRLSSISIDSYSFVHDAKSGGFKASLKWFCEDKRVRLFKIYKSVLGADLLKRNYKVDELALSRLTEKKSFALENKILYDKNAFTKNKSIDLTSNGDSHRQSYKDSSTSVFFQVAFIRSNNTGEYTFVDRNVKFGESYYYQIVGVVNDLRETPKTKPVLVTAELPSAPPPPDVVTTKITSEGILMTIGNRNHGSMIQGYEIHRLNKKTKKYELVFFVVKKEISDFVNFIDSPDELGFEEHYKIFSVNIFGTKSISSKKMSVIFDTIFEKKRETEIPKFELFKEENSLKIRIYNTNSRFFKVERKDLSRNEQKFSLKSKNGIFWNQSNYFDINKEYIDFIDLSVRENENYQYKITNIENLGDDGGFVITPSIKFEEGLKYKSYDEDPESKNKNASLTDLQVFVKDRKRNPSLVYLRWNHSGEDSNYFKLKFTSGMSENLEIDGSLSEVLIELDKGKEYSFDFCVFSEDGELVLDKKGNSLKT